MSLKLPQIIGHRGCAAYAPENTIESIHTAADMGVQWVELDVKITKDDVPVLFHDDTLERTTNGSGALADLTFDDLRQLEAGSWFSDSFSGVLVPSLEEAVDALLARNLGLNLEIKACPGREVETAEAALDVLSHIWDDHERLVISSFSHVSLETSMDMAQAWHRGLLLPEDFPDNWQEIADHLEVSALHINGNACSSAQLEAFLAYGKPLMAYTINDPAQAHLLQSQGVRCICSDEPDAVQDGLLTLH